MKSEEKYLITKHYKDITSYTTFDEYIKKVCYWKEGECGIAPCYVEDEYFWKDNSEIKITKDEIKKYLFSTKKEAVNKLIEYLKELIDEYELKINNLKKILITSKLLLLILPFIVIGII